MPSARPVAFLVICGLSVGLSATAAQAPTSWLAALRPEAGRLIAAARADDFAWRRLAELTDEFGPRLSGSDNLARAIEWAATEMKADGLENVRTEAVRVPRWIRGEEAAEIVDAPRRPLVILGLGGSAPTPPEGIEAEVLVVRSFDDLRAKAGSVRGRIVLFDVPYTGYSETAVYRTTGARAAAGLGAVAVLVRSVGPAGLRTPHTGAVTYVPNVPAIPAAAVAVEDANRLARLTREGRSVRVRLLLRSHYEADADSANVIGEIVGRERPHEVVLVGGHFDSWDVGTGASDDGAGCIATWEALRLMVKLGIRPRRTVRVVLWTNEENGLGGATAYAERYASSAGDHVLALEADMGVFNPAGFGFTGSPAAHAVMAQIATLLAPLGLLELTTGGGGADIGPIARAGRVPTMAYLGDADRYFLIHHTEADTVERIAPAEMSQAAAAIAVVAHAVAEMPERLPK
jgi:carboxypeptidase Q